MKGLIILLPLLCFPFFGCTSDNGSPTGALVRGEIAADEYLGAVREANEEARANEQFEVNREPTRAYNTKTGKVEYIPDGASQKWNEEAQRWEFTTKGN